MTPLTLLHKEYAELGRYLSLDRQRGRDRLEFQRLALQRLIAQLIGPPLGGWK